MHQVRSPSLESTYGSRAHVEPGRAVAGPAAVTLSEVRTVKDLDGIRTYVSVDGGMSDNVRTALYGGRPRVHIGFPHVQRAADVGARGRQAL